MPYSPKKPCAQHGCAATVPRDQRYCDQHRRGRHRAYNKTRPESDRFYKTAAWKKCRDWFLANNPLCVICRENNFLEPATVVDHIIPYKERPDLGLDPDNLRALCASCHARHGKRAGRGGVKSL